MKHFLWLAGAAALAATSAQAQSIKFGLKAGANLTNLAGNLANQNQYVNRWGFHGGAALNIGLVGGDFLSLQPEVLYSQKGFRYDDAYVASGFGFSYRNSGNVRYDYLDVPVLLKLKLPGGVFFELGPQYSYLLNVKSERTRTLTAGGVTSTNYNAETENLSQVNRNELGYAGGLGFQSSQGLLLGLRYNGAFTDFAKDGYSGNDFKNARNSAFQGYVGFLLGGK